MLMHHKFAEDILNDLLKKSQKIGEFGTGIMQAEIYAGSWAHMQMLLIQRDKELHHQDSTLM